MERSRGSSVVKGRRLSRRGDSAVEREDAKGRKCGNSYIPANRNCKKGAAGGAQPAASQPQPRTRQRPMEEPTRRGPSGAFAGEGGRIGKSRDTLAEQRYRRARSLERKAIRESWDLGPVKVSDPDAMDRWRASRRKVIANEGRRKAQEERRGLTVAQKRSLSRRRRRAIT